MPSGDLIEPYGGTLVDLIVGPDRAAEMKAAARDFASLTLDDRSLCDLELLSVGGFSPLRGFLNREDYESVLSEGRLADGTLWPLPVTLPVTPGEGVAEGKTLALRDVYGNLLAFLHVEEIYEADRSREAEEFHGTPDGSHPSAAWVDRTARYHAAGPLEVIRTPPHYDFVDLRRTPAELREHFRSLGWSRIVAFPTSTPLHRADEEMARRAARMTGGGLLIQPSVGVTKPGDVDHYTRIRCYRAFVAEGFEAGNAVLSLLPLAERRAGPREVLLRAIVARNYGCSDLIVEGDHSSLGTMADQAGEIGVGLVAPGRMVYLPVERRYLPIDEVPDGARTATLSEAEVHDNYLSAGLTLPDWFTRPAVARILAETHPPRSRQGLTIWFTGLSGSGKSTVAHALIERLAESGRNCAFLDGDEIRTHLSRGLGFSREDRDINIRRVGYVAGLVCRAGGTTVCSVISPFRAVRDEARAMSRGHFVEVYCSTPIEICERRDVKGLYSSARAAVAAGRPMGFTGVDDPYEAPEGAEVTLDTSKLSVDECVEAIVAKLVEQGYIVRED